MYAWYIPLILLGGLFSGGGLVYLVMRPKIKLWQRTAEEEAERIRRKAETHSESILAHAQKQAQQLKEDQKQQEQVFRERLERQQQMADERLLKREEALDQKTEKLEEAREECKKVQSLAEAKQKELEQKIANETESLAKIAKLSAAEAKEKLLAQIEEKYESELADSMRRRLEARQQQADQEAADIVVQAIQRYSSTATADITTSVVKLESDDIKGKIIGREGRNINAFERLTGVDLIVDDSPGTITLSCFDMFRRFVAKVALENLLKDGRIHPSRIEEAIRKAESEADKMILEAGKKACQDLGIALFPDPILKLVGRLRFRTSYGQNVLQHSMEVAYLGATMAHDIPGVDAEILKKAGLVHDIGKAVTHEVEGGHAIIGMEILEKFGVEPAVVTAMKSHHEDFPYESIEARVLQAADAISASRPGARRETMEKYLKRLKDLEGIGMSFPGVDKVYAIQAGHELRVFVNAQAVNDLESEKMSFAMARKIEQNCQYPGEVQVVIIRESRYEGVAK